MSIPIMPDTASPTPERGVAFVVHGTPAPQGSKRAFVVGNARKRYGTVARAEIIVREVQP